MPTQALVCYRAVVAVAPNIQARLPLSQWMEFRQISRERGIGPCTLVRNVLLAWLDRQAGGQASADAASDHPTGAQVPRLPDGRDVHHEQILRRIDNLRPALIDERPSAMGMLVDK